ncbi:MAG: polysaccharide biosynthesis/export family protein [Candidatus Krumholzibacteriota bacterium]|nr:polysaccharide biosynthesis/export family protein [Candidatus Krumholzibacteriota bacterium]
MNIRGDKFKYIRCLIFVSIFAAGCSSGNRLIDTKNGEIETKVLSPDSIPHSYSTGKYRFGYGDAFDVNFLYNDEYSKPGIIVSPDGNINFPYVGEINVNGMTVSQLDSVLTTTYSRILKNPDISIIPQQFRPQYVYLLGEVRAPGGYQAYKARTLLEALSLGGGITKKAKRNGVIVIRRVGLEHVVAIEIDLKKIVNDNRYEYNIPIEPSDIVMIPESKIYQVSGFVASFIDIIKDPLDLYLRGWQFVQMKAVYDYYKLRAAEE